MPVVTIQLGQCGNQLGSSLFQNLSSELEKGDYGVQGLEDWFRPVSATTWRPGTATHHARSVLIDMEPKVVQSVVAAAARSGSWWRYAPGNQLCMSSGAGNNWAHGFNGYGPTVHAAAVDLIRKEVEACDMLGGFLLLQSMAGGTGAGLGTYIARALRDEFPSSHALNCCVWPYESGEVIVQPYNSLLTLSHLAGVADGIVLLENEALHATAQKLYKIARPSFQDMNLVAARCLANMLLPSNHRPATNPNSEQPDTRFRNVSKQSWHRHTASAGSNGLEKGYSGSAMDGLAQGVGSLSMTGNPVTFDWVAPPGVLHGHEASSSSRPVRMLSEVLGHCAAHPGYRLMSLRSLPQMPATSVDFTTFSWLAILKRLRQMLVTGSALEEGLNWGLHTSHSLPSHSPASNPAGKPASSPEVNASSRVAMNKSVAAWLVLRGQGSGNVDVASSFSDPGMYGSWCIDPLSVSSHPARFARCDMAAALLSTDQACVKPCSRMLDRAQHMFDARAYVHQYEAYGLTPADFEACFGVVTDVVQRYELL